MFAVLLMLHEFIAVWSVCECAFFPANSYTLTGVVSVNGSDADGGCPQACVRMSSNITKCDCMGTSREGNITGVLIDGMIPTIDTSQRGNWASQLFTVQASMTSYALGFRFQSHVALQEMELYVLYCPAWQIGATTINVYDSTTYPSFIRTAPNVGSVTLTSNMQNCESLTRVSIPLKTTLRISSYFIEFTNPTQVHWLHIAEVRFSDQPIPNSTITTTLAITNTACSQQELTNHTSHNVAPTITSQVFSSAMPTSVIPSSQQINIITPSSTHVTADMNDDVGTNPSSTPVAIIGALVGVAIVILIFLLIGGVILIGFFRRKKKSHQREVQLLQNAMLEGNMLEGNMLEGNMPEGNIPESNMLESNNMSPKINLDAQEETKNMCFNLPENETEAPKQNRNTGLLESKQEESCVSSDTLETKVKVNMYSLLHKASPPPIPDKMFELQNELEHGYAVVGNKTSVKEGRNTMHSSSTKTDRQEEVAYYNTIQKSNKNSTSISTAIATNNSGKHKKNEREDHEGKDHKGEDLHSEAYANDTERVLNISSTSDLIGLSNQDSDGDLNKSSQEDGAKLQEESKDDIYDAVYNEPIKPSMFTEKIKTDASETLKEAKEEEEEEMYAPIYTLPSSTETDSLLQLKPENIKKIKTIGTGYFGKVILANTVGLSLKDLKMNDTDDDKSKSIRVAVKQLKKNPSASRKEAFDKELKFMSRLDHPNVIRTLGACVLDTPFIMMEYMEIGDLSKYLQDFDSIVEGNDPPGNFKISTGTLTNMSAQIANAMKYLASRNFIHRDLATRNCLVGPDHQIKIADFGMSQSLYASHYYVLQGHAALPVRWMAKECFYGKFSAKTDVWAFGVTMWEIFTLSKNTPYEDMADLEVVADATKKDGSRMLLEKPENCPQEVYDVMVMCWAEESKDRATFGELHDALLSLVLDSNK